MHAQSHIQQRQVKSARVVGPEHPSQCPGSADTSTEKSYPVGAWILSVSGIASYLYWPIFQCKFCTTVVIVDGKFFYRNCFHIGWAVLGT